MVIAHALLVGHVEGEWRRRIDTIELDALADGEVRVRVLASGVNFKDGLASSSTGRVARIDPLVPGIDLAGEVIESTATEVPVGTMVLAHGYDIGVSRHGGFATVVDVPAHWVIPIPAGLAPTLAMTVGTAGFTAALSVAALERHGLRPGDGAIVVTGATGGVGSMAVGMLARLGHEIVATTGKSDQHDWLRALGADEVLDRADLLPDAPRPLERERWAAGIDCVGGATLAHVLSSISYGGAVAASGLTGGAALPTTVLPFILRGVSLLGIDSVQTPIGERRTMWGRIADDLRPTWLGEADGPWTTTVVGLEGLAGQLDRILDGGMTGRVVVDPTR